MSLRSVFLVVLAFVLQGCATNVYEGPKPNLNLRNSAGLREYKQFELVDTDGLFGRGAYLTMGPEQKRYTLVSMRPVVEQVSPIAMTELDRAIKWRRVEIVSLQVTIATAIAAIFNSDRGTRDILGTVAVLGGASTLWASSKVSDAVLSTTKEYNQEIKRKLAPQLEARWTF